MPFPVRSEPQPWKGELLPSLPFLFFSLSLFIYFQRDRDCIGGGGAEEGDGESQAVSMLPVVEPITGFEPER